MNHRLEYGDRLVIGVCWSIAEVVHEINFATASSSPVYVWMGGDCVIWVSDSPMRSQSARSYALRGLRSAFRDGLRDHSE